VYLDTGASFILQWNSLEVFATKSKFLSIAAAAFKLATFTRSSMTVASAILLGNVIAVFVRTLFICTFGGPILGIGHRAAAHINGRSLLLVRLLATCSIDSIMQVTFLLGENEFCASRVATYS